MKKILLTGATSFVGRNLVQDVLDHTDWQIYSLERLPRPESRPWQALGDPDGRFHRVYHDLRAEVPLSVINRVGDADYVVHLAAEVSAAKSLNDPITTVETNVVGTFNTLELARRLPYLERFIYVSTGEVLGPVPFPFKLDESKPLRPTSPYAASKAAGEALVNAYHVSYELPALVVRPMGMFGRFQTRGFIPTIVDDLIHGRTIECHAGKERYDSRNWLSVKSFTTITRWLLECGKVGEIYHVAGPERDNLEIITTVAKALGKTPVIHNVYHEGDHRYVLEDTKLLSDWELGKNLDEALSEFVRG